MKLKKLGENDIETKNMAMEQFGRFLKSKEIQIDDLHILKREHILDYFRSSGYNNSILVENIVEYLYNNEYKITFQEYYQFIKEKLTSINKRRQMKICYSIYSMFAEKLYLYNIYEYFDDPLWKYIINDITLIHELIKMKNTAIDNQKKDYSSLSIRIPDFKKMGKINVTQEAGLTTEKNNQYLTFDEFTKINFPDKVPGLLYFIIYLMCGEDLLDYYTEKNGIKGYKFIQIKSKGKSDFLIERVTITFIDMSMKRQRKLFNREAKRIEPTMDQKFIDLSIDLFQTMKTKDSKTFKITVKKNEFISHSVRDY